jgi:hypothetical protein
MNWARWGASHCPCAASHKIDEQFAFSTKGVAPGELASMRKYFTTKNTKDTKKTQEHQACEARSATT